MNQNNEYPYFSPSFTCPPPNPNPNFLYSFPQNPPPPLPLPPPPPASLNPSPSSTTTTALLPPTPDLLTALSTLTQFINLAESTITSVSTIISSNNSSSANENFIPCPFDLHHRMPPESLFRHSLQCPSSPGVIDLEILHSLHYPKSIKSQHELGGENQFFIQNLSELTDDLCFSIDGYGDFGVSFFYKDCPSVYCAAELDSSKRTFTLPRVLVVHCANFIQTTIDESNDVRCLDMGILPSDLLSVRREVEAWKDYPCSYSFLVLRVVLSLSMIDRVDCLKWIISNSPRYGVIIDLAMRDHIFLLLRLCLKAITLEGHRSNELLMYEDVKLRDGGSNFVLKYFSCPVLAEVLSWLASQLSVLYGEPNGKFLAINMLKHCLLNAATRLLAFSKNKVTETETGVLKEGLGKLGSGTNEMSCEVSKDKLIGNIKIEEPSGECEKGKPSRAAYPRDSSVFVSQVAAAIAALWERSLLEEKIKGLRVARSLSKSQRLAESSYITMKADEERRKRSNYRPILEHDGLLWHRSRNQDDNKNKTREELLAEERDYKCRRMSYRGKKVKRSITEVMRDIIEQHMSEINQAGGIGCFVKGSIEGNAFPPGSVSVKDVNAGNEIKRSLCDSPGPNGGKPVGYRKQSEEPQIRESHKKTEVREDRQTSSRKDKQDRDYRSRSPKKHKDGRDRDYRSRSPGKHRKGRDRDYRSRSPEKHRNGRDRDYRSRSPEKHRDGRSHEKYSHGREHYETKRSRSKYDDYDSVSPHRAKYRDGRSFSSLSNPSTDSRDRKFDQISESRDHRRRAHGSRKSESVRHTLFEDRYDPTESDDRYVAAYDDESSESKYLRRDKLCDPISDNYSDRKHRVGSTEKE